MSDETVIVANQLTKAYRIWKDPARRLTSPIYAELGRWLPASLGQSLRNRAQDGYRDFFALHEVTFEVKRGEAVAIIGRNGAGKSTLLQLIAGTLQATSGSINVHGRVAALLELGAGFNLDFTGRENVFLSGSILGLKQKEMESRFDEIAAFADIGDFIDQPVKTYSSGMMMRLAFAVNTCVDPDILIVDEALSVGDAPFQAKCFRRLRQLIEKGVSLLFVSHDIGTVRSICSRALWLKNGNPEMWGEAKQVAKMYERFCWQEQGVMLDPQGNVDPSMAEDTNKTVMAWRATTDPEIVPSVLLQPNPDFDIAKQNTRIGTGAVLIDNFAVTKVDGTLATVCEYNEALEFLYFGHTCADIDSEVVLSVRFRDLQGNYVFSAHDIYEAHRLVAKKHHRFFAKFTLQLPLHHQQYSITTGIFGFQGGESGVKGSYDFGLADLWDVIEDAAFLKVNPCPVMPLPGPVHITTSLSFRILP